VANRGADPWSEACGAAGACKREPSGQVPCSGAKRRGKALDEVSTAIPGGAAAWNAANQPRAFCVGCISFVIPSSYR